MMKKIWQGVLYPIFMYLACSMVGKWIGDAFPNYVDMTLALGIGAIFAIVILYLYAKYNKNLIVELCFKNEKKLDIRKIIYIIPISFSFSIFFNVLIDITKLNEFFPEGADLSEKLFSSNIIVIILSTMILAPMAEEIVFRGYVYKSIKGYGGKIIASLVSAILFGFIHGNVVQGLYAFISTFLFIFIYDNMGNIFSTIFAHSIANLSGFFLSMCGVYYLTLLFVHKILLIIICVALFLMSMWRFVTYEKSKV